MHVGRARNINTKTIYGTPVQPGPDYSIQFRPSKAGPSASVTLTNIWFMFSYMVTVRLRTGFSSRNVILPGNCAKFSICPDLLVPFKDFKTSRDHNFVFVSKRFKIGERNALRQCCRDRFHFEALISKLASKPRLIRRRTTPCQLCYHSYYFNELEFAYDTVMIPRDIKKF